MERKFKIVMVGTTGVGKTSIVSSFIDDKFESIDKPTIGAAFYTYNSVDINNNKTKLEIWDTAGQERFLSLIPMYTRGANMIIIVYDVGSPNTYKNLSKYWLPNMQSTEPGALICLVEAKIDLIPNNEETETTRCARELAQQNKCLFWRVSSKTKTNIREMFADITQKLISIESDIDPDSDLDLDLDKTMSLNQPINTSRHCC
jgi:small GTP-binding protein